MKTWSAKGKSSSFATTALAFTSGRKGLPPSKPVWLPSRAAAAPASRPCNRAPGLTFASRSIIWEDRAAAAASQQAGEESLDFAGEDTSERLGAERLRKVSQKTCRCPFWDRQGE